jgi:hypothetical protein
MVYPNNNKKLKNGGIRLCEFLYRATVGEQPSIGEIACKFEIGELVSKIGRKSWTHKSINLLSNLGLRGHSIPCGSRQCYHLLWHWVLSVLRRWASLGPTGFFPLFFVCFWNPVSQPCYLLLSSCIDAPPPPPGSL